jgi:hypothetical protein
MKYRVRTPEGELCYSSILELTKAYLLGLVEPTDEVQREGETRWRKAASIPQLAQAKKPPRHFFADPHMRWALVLAAIGSMAVFSFLYGAKHIGALFVLAFAVIGLQWLTRWQRKKPRK